MGNTDLTSNALRTQRQGLAAALDYPAPKEWYFVPAPPRGRASISYTNANVIAVITVMARPVMGDPMLEFYQPSSEFVSLLKDKVLSRDRVDHESRKRALRELFAWIESHEPVPHISLEGMDRDEIY